MKKKKRKRVQNKPIVTSQFYKRKICIRCNQEKDLYIVRLNIRDMGKLKPKVTAIGCADCLNDLAKEMGD